MSSLFTAAAIGLSRLGLAELSGLEVIVGGLGLGCTAQAVWGGLATSVEPHRVAGTLEELA